MAKPTLVLSHGSWHSPEHYGPLVKELEKHGYKCVTVASPSTQSPDLPPASLADDTAAIRDAVVAELNQGNNVVMVSHSYSGTPANNAMQGLDQKSRSNAGKSSALLAIAFLCSIPSPQGGTFIQQIGGAPGPIHDRRNEEFTWVGEPGGAYWFYNDLSTEEAKKWSDMLRPQAWGVSHEKTTYAAYMDIPSSFLFCTKDNAFPFEAQKALVAAAVDAGARFGYSETLESSHSPFLSMPEATSKFIRKVADDASVMN